MNLSAPLSVIVALGLAGCGSGVSRVVTADDYGDPLISDLQANAVRIGSSAQAAFRTLGGKATSGRNGRQAGPAFSYDYPIKGSGDPNDVSKDAATWWEFCVLKGRVVSKARGKLGDFSDCQRFNFPD